MKQNRGEISPAAIRTAKRASGPDLSIPAEESAPLPQGTVTAAPAVDLFLHESAKECPAPVAAIRTAKRASRVAHEPDLLISVAESAPLPKGPATGAPATDLLYESIQECLASAEERKHEDRIGHERVKHGIQTRAELLKHHMQECVPEPALEPALEPAPACLLITPDDPPRSGGWHSGQSGKHSKDKAGGASVKWADAGWSDNDMLIESDDRPRRVTVVAPIQQLRQPKMNRSGALPALRPKSRAECERRCGSDGFCDPSDPLGCGGLHCGQQHNMLD